VGRGVQKEGEKVYLKATGRAIPKALGLGVEFQNEAKGGHLVRVEMGSVKAVDDVEVTSKGGATGEEVAEEDDIPETRIRTVSSVTISIGLK
jgi:ribonuclease P/MRP protein subunit POP7